MAVAIEAAPPPPYCAAPLPFDEFSGGQWWRGARYQLLSLLGHCAKGKANRQRSFVMPPQNRTFVSTYYHDFGCEVYSISQ
jgi:hypothetical protein